MLARLILPMLLLVPAMAAQPTLPDKYSPILYEHLPGKEKARCEKYVNELVLIEKRKKMGAKPWDLEKMAAKQAKIEADYDKYCLRLQK